MSTRLAQARERERTRVMREVSAIAVHLFSERGYGNVRMEDLAEASGVSVATLYRRFSTKENLVHWQADEQGGMAALLAAVRSGRRISDAAMDLARSLPGDAVDAIEDRPLAPVVDRGPCLTPGGRQGEGGILRRGRPRRFGRARPAIVARAGDRDALSRRRARSRQQRVAPSRGIAARMQRPCPRALGLGLAWRESVAVNGRSCIDAHRGGVGAR